MFPFAKQKQIKESTKNAQNTVSKRDQKKIIKKQRIAQNMIRYNQMMENGICIMDDDLYSRAIRFTDINYRIAPEDIQERIILQYSDMLNAMGNDIDVSLVINNRLINKEEFEKSILMKHRGDGLDPIRAEMNQHMLNNMQKGNNAIVSEKMFVFTVREKNYEDAIKSLESSAKGFQNHLQKLGCETEILDGKQRLETLFTITKPSEPFYFDYKDLTPKCSSKDYISPYSFEFKKDYFIMDDRYCSVMVLNTYPTWLQDKLLSDLSKIESNLLITFHMQIKTKEDSLTLINQTSQKVDMQIDTENQKNLNRANFSGKLPPKLQQQEESVAQWRVAIEEDDQRMFQCQLLVMVNASSYSEMIEVQKEVQRVAKSLNASFITMNLEQEIGFNCALPLGLPKEGLGRNLLTDNVARLLPFASMELLQKKDPIYYGNNKTTNNMILCNRKNLANQNGFILGKSGSGKSFKVKAEITRIFANDDNADVIIIDPQGEYKKLADTFNTYGNEKQCDVLEVNTHSDLHFNPLEGDITQPDFLTRKSEIVMVMMAEMIGNGYLNGEQRSIIDQCVNDIYFEYEYNLENNPALAKIPTLKTFYNKLGTYTSETAQAMFRSLWTYVSGSYDLFAQESNVNVKSRMVIYDISELGESIRTLGLKVILENVREQVLQNSSKGKRTWVYIDEIYRLLKDEFSENFLSEFWKWVRKFGGACTGISQDVTDVLRSQQCCTMLSNSEFYIILAQDSIDLVQLKSLLNLSDEQTRFVLTASKGEGLLRFGNTIIPFEDTYPKDTILYQTFNTDAEVLNKRKEHIEDLQKRAKRIQEAEKRKILSNKVIEEKKTTVTENDNLEIKKSKSIFDIKKEELANHDES